jgi:EVE domain-containing protein
MDSSRELNSPRHFLAVAAFDAIAAARAAGHVEINRGRAAPLERMRDGDLLLYYSPRDRQGGEPLQAFTALARIRGGALYQADGGSGDDAEAGQRFCRSAEYFDVQPAPIRPLIDALAFIRNKTHWGAPLRFGFMRLSAADFALIAHAMGVDSACAAPGASVDVAAHA